MEESVPFSVASVVEEVLRLQGKRFNDIRKVDQSSLRRYQAAEWLRKTVGVVLGKDLPAEPSEQHFRLALRSGIILCHVLNRVQPGSISKVVEAPSNDSVLIPDGTALSAYQYFENVRNFLVAMEEMGLPSFEASDLEEGGQSSRIVNCVLALKSYNEWKQGGGNGYLKMGDISKPTNFVKSFARKSSEPFMNSISKPLSLNERPMDGLSTVQSSYSDQDMDLSKASSHSLNTLVHAALSDKRQDEIPAVVESMLNKVMEEFKRRINSQDDLMKTSSKDATTSTLNRVPLENACYDTKELEQVQSSSSDATRMLDEKASALSQEEEMDEVDGVQVQEEKDGLDAAQVQEDEMKIEEAKYADENSQISNHDESSKLQLAKQIMLVEKQQRDVQELKQTLHDTKAGLKLLQINYREEFCTLGTHMHSLSHAASGYQRVLQENRKLYNQIQDLKGNIRVYCRVRPFMPGHPSRINVVDHIEEGNIMINTPLKYGKEGCKSFSFNKVFGASATQAEVFADMQPLIRSILDGYNVCIFAYGQTGSGKTHTMTGPKELTEETRGVNYRALGDLFFLSEQRADLMSYDISVQMMEIYNEQVRDLLAADGSNKRLEIRNSSQNGINVPDANLVPVSSTADVIRLMNLGHKNRAVSSTAMNDRSSRSHSCLTVHVQGRDLTSGKVTRGSMHLVDLAGSERVDKSEVTGDRLKEAVHINKSLSALGDVIACLAQRNTHVPYRNSKLTQLLQDSLGGQAKTLMFVHISPEPEAIGETLSTLKFAERVATVELGAAQVNRDGADVKELKDQISSLKAALAKNSGEKEHIRQSRSSSPHPVLQGGKDKSSSRRQSFGTASVESNSATKSRRQSFDLHDMMSSPASPRSIGKEDDGESSTSGDWVDKSVVNKRVSLTLDDNGVENWQVDSRELSEMFYQKQTPNGTKVHLEQSCGKPSPITKYSQAQDDESETATSDSSEIDSNRQSSLPRTNSMPSALGTVSKIKKPQARPPSKARETRRMIPTTIPSPSPSRKLAPSGSGIASRTGRQQVHADGKRRAASGK